jgi:hypothetical protein
MPLHANAAAHLLQVDVLPALLLVIMTLTAWAPRRAGQLAEELELSECSEAREGQQAPHRQIRTVHGDTQVLQLGEVREALNGCNSRVLCMRTAHHNSARIRHILFFHT